jgi:hypothetical protein
MDLIAIVQNIYLIIIALILALKGILEIFQTIFVNNAIIIVIIVKMMLILA